MYYLFLSALTVIFMLVLLKVNVREFFTSISIIAAAIAIVAKDYISNAINGMILMFNNQISINDYIRIGAYEGRISHITLMNLQLVNENDDLIFIPNNTVLSSEVINFTKGESHKTAVEFTTETKFISTIDNLEAYLMENAVKLNEHVIVESFRLIIISSKSTSLRLKAEVKLKTNDRRQERLFKKQIINAWLHYLKTINSGV
jgi:small-conductance mechanosensitive channel